MKRYLIALALALGIVAASVATSQTGATTRTPCTMKASIHLDYTDFRDRRRTCRAQAHHALERRCRSHQRAHFTTWAQDVLKVDRHRNLYGWFALRRRVRALSGQCLTSWPAVGKTLAAERYGWINEQWKALYALWNGESGWDPYKWNYAGSGACGIPQFLPCRYYGDGRSQIVAGLAYIADRYGSPVNAYAHFQAVNWY